MIHYIKIKTYHLAPKYPYSGLAVIGLTVDKEVRISIGSLILFEHKSNSTNQYQWNFLTKTWAIFLVELHDKIHGEENGKIDWFNSPKVILQSKLSLLSLIIKAFIIYQLLF